MSMFFTQRPTPAQTYSPYAGQRNTISPEQYYRQIAAEHQRQAERALALAQREREEATRRRQLEILRARQEAARREVATRLQASLYGQGPFGGRRPQPQVGSQPQQLHSWHSNPYPQPEEYGYDALLSQFLRAMAVEEQRTTTPRRPIYTVPTEKKVCRFATQRQPDSKPRRQAHFEQHQLAPSQDKGKAKAHAAPEPAPRRNEADFLASLFGLLAAGEHEKRQAAPVAPQGGSVRPTAAREGVVRPTGTQRGAPTAPKTQPTRPQPVMVPSPSVRVASAPSSPSSIHSHSFTSLDNLETQFVALKSNFVFPSSLDFEGASQELQYTHNNAPVRQYEGDLTKLLTKLDAVESDGAESVRGARKAIVKAVEAELDRVDALKEEAWRKSQVVEAKVPTVAAVAAEAVVVPLPESPAEVKEEEKSTPSGAVAQEELAVSSGHVHEASGDATEPDFALARTPVQETQDASASPATYVHTPLDAQPATAAPSAEAEEVVEHTSESEAASTPVSEPQHAVSTIPESEPVVEQEAAPARSLAAEETTGEPVQEDAAPGDDESSSEPMYIPGDLEVQPTTVIIEDSQVVLPDADASSSEDEELVEQSDDGSLEFVSDQESTRGDDFELL